jgi:amino acid permease
VIPAIVFIIIGAFLSNYSSLQIVKAAEVTQLFKYEQLASAALSPFWAKFTSVSMIASMLGFSVTYIIYIKTLFPHLVLIFVNPDYNPFEPDPLPEIFSSN